MSNAYLRFWGVRGSYAAPFATHLGVGGNTSCVEIRVDDHVLICDAGTGVITFGNELIKQSEIRELLIILTHYHWDHVGDDNDEIKDHVSSQMRAPYFPVGTESWLANIQYLSPSPAGMQHGPIKIEYKNVHHPGTTYGYRMLVNGKSVIYISDNECSFIEKSVSQKRGTLNDEEQALYDDMIEEEHHSELELIRNADILIHDAQYTPEDYEKKQGWGHSCYIDTIHMAIDADVKELYLYHHDPNYDDKTINTIHEHAKQIIKERNASLKCHVAREGMQIDL